VIDPGHDPKEGQDLDQHRQTETDQQVVRAHALHAPDHDHAVQTEMVTKMVHTMRGMAMTAEAVTKNDFIPNRASFNSKCNHPILDVSFLLISGLDMDTNDF